MAADDFKLCPCCRQRWTTRSEFLRDTRLILNGFQADFESAEDGVLLFTHQRDQCGSTMAVRIREFADLCSAPCWNDCLHGTSTCPRHCDDVVNLEPCDQPCRNAFARSVVQVVRARLQSSAPAAP